jgi:hypothetical protein
MAAKAEVILNVLYYLLTLKNPSLQMLEKATGCSKQTLRRHFKTLCSQYGVKVHFERSQRAADGGIGIYVLEDTGVFDSVKVVNLVNDQHPDSH